MIFPSQIFIYSYGKTKYKKEGIFKEYQGEVKFKSGIYDPKIIKSCDSSLNFVETEYYMNQKIHRRGLFFLMNIFPSKNTLTWWQQPIIKI